MAVKYRVCCMNEKGEVQKSYVSPSVLFAKRFADLYKDAYFITEIRLQMENGEEQVYESFLGKKLM